MDELLDVWMDLGPTVAPSRIADVTRLEIRTTHQRRAPWWPVRRIPIMNNTIVRYGLAAAAVIVIALLGTMFLPVSNRGGGPAATALPTPTPQPLSDGPLKAGTVVAAGLGPSEPTSVTFTVPKGWEGFAGRCVLPTAGTQAPDGMGICFLEVLDGLYSDPCHGHVGAADVPVGPTAEELANALADQTAYDASAPTDITISGYSGKRIDLQLPSDVATCDNGEFTPWNGSVHAQGPDDHWRLWILDVEGKRLIIEAGNYAGTSSQDLAEQQAIVDSIRIEP